MAGITLERWSGALLRVGPPSSRLVSPLDMAVGTWPGVREGHPRTGASPWSL